MKSDYFSNTLFCFIHIIIISIILLVSFHIEAQDMVTFVNADPDNYLTAETSNLKRQDSYKPDFGRSVIGTVIGGFVGAGLIGYLPIYFDPGFDRSSFPDNKFYVRSYIGSAVVGAIGAATWLHLSKRRRLPYWKSMSYSLIPPFILVLPTSLYALSEDRDELLKTAWIATALSLTITPFWITFIYRLHPLKGGDKLSMSIMSPVIKPMFIENGIHTFVGINLIEFRF